MLGLMNRIIRNRVRKVSFPKLHHKKFNRLWEISKNTLTGLTIFEIIPIMRSLIFKFGASSLLGIPIIFLIFKKSGILEEKETTDHLKMFKALNVDNNNIEYFITTSLFFGLLLKIIKSIAWLLWLPLKIAIIIYILDWFNFDVSYIYYKLNNLSLGTLNWYYQTLIDFLEKIEYLRFKYEFNIIIK